MAGLRVLLTKCNLAQDNDEEEIDSHNKGQILQLFQGKKASKMSKYIKELISLDNELRTDKKLMRKLFSDK